MEKVKPCDSCGTNRWKTKKKGEQYECRKCGNVRNIQVLTGVASTV